MKTNTLNVILAAVASSVLTLVATNKVAVDAVDLIVIGVSYTAVAGLAVMAAWEYRGNVKRYSMR